jgi:hypothetical protein
MIHCINLLYVFMLKSVLQEFLAYFIFPIHSVPDLTPSLSFTW